MTRTSPLQVELLASDGLPALADALERAGLPNADIGQPDPAFFRFSNDGGVVGFGGLEGETPDLLLRSLVVLPDRRGQGIGTALLRGLEQEAVERGCQRLHLLTTTAEGFFLRHGFQAASRQAAPATIAASAEFTALCPASAHYLIKVLS